MNEFDYGIDLQNAYEDGFDDGIKAATPKWIPCSERFPIDIDKFREMFPQVEDE